MAHLIENKSDESLEKLNNSLAQADLRPHPFLSDVLGGLLEAVVKPTRVSSAQSTVSNVPIETQKRREAEASGKPFIVPDWWRGERTNYEVAKTMMKTVPKDIGPLKN